MIASRPAVHCREAAAKQRLALLKANDAEAYLKLVKSAKNSRLTQLLGQTDACLNNLAARLRLKTQPPLTSISSAAEKEGTVVAAAFNLGCILQACMHLADTSTHLNQLLAIERSGHVLDDARHVRFYMIYYGENPANRFL